MILKALYDYYNRCGNLAPAGLEYKEIAFLIVIDGNGRFVRIENCLDETGKKGSEYLVPKGVGRSSNVMANILWDNCSYVIGLSAADFIDETEGDNTLKTDDIKKERNKNRRNNEAFVKRVDELLQLMPDNIDLHAISLFYSSGQCSVEVLQKDKEWGNLKKNLKRNISFLIDGDVEIVPAKSVITDYARVALDDIAGKSRKHVCLITGNKSSLVETTGATSIPGSQATAKLVSFQVDSGYDSYGKSKGYNAPISTEAEFAYTTALKTLLSKDSKNRFVIGDRTFVFWASSHSEAAKITEESVWDLFGMKECKDNPNRHVRKVKDAFNSIYSGKIPTDKDDRFYILGLSPNAARIAVVYWNECSLKEFAGNILKHFNDTEIIEGRDNKPYQGLHQMLSAVTLGGKSSEVQPSLPEAVIKSILQGTPYPMTLLQACIRRIRAEVDKGLYRSRTAILKGCLNRTNDNNKKIDIMLDKSNDNAGYLCGRLFAVLVKMQEDANGIKTVQERFMNSASATPASVFATILNLSVHHAEKLEIGKSVYYEKLKQEIIEKICDFPARLDLHDQGRFFIGYYHQRQDFFRVKDCDGAEDKEK